MVSFPNNDEKWERMKRKQKEDQAKLHRESKEASFRAAQAAEELRKHLLKRQEQEDRKDKFLEDQENRRLEGVARGTERDASMETEALDIMRTDNLAKFKDHIHRPYRGDTTLSEYWFARKGMMGITDTPPLLEAFKAGALNIINMMVEGHTSTYGALVSFTNGGKQTPLNYAPPQTAMKFSTSEMLSRVLTTTNNKEAVSSVVRTMLTANPKSVNGLDGYNWGQQAVHVAAEYNAPEALRAIVSVGGREQLETRSRCGKCAIHYAVQDDKNVSTVQVLLSLGDDVDRKDGNGDTALHHAARSNAVAMLRFLISHNANRKAKNNNGQTARQTASSSSAKNMLGGSSCECALM